MVTTRSVGKKPHPTDQSGDAHSGLRDNHPQLRFLAFYPLQLSFPAQGLVIDPGCHRLQAVLIVKGAKSEARSLSHRGKSNIDYPGRAVRSAGIYGGYLQWHFAPTVIPLGFRVHCKVVAPNYKLFAESILIQLGGTKIAERLF